MEIKTNRLIIRDFRDDDFPHFEKYHLDSRFNEFYSDEEKSPEHAAMIFWKIRGWAGEVPRKNFQMAVTRKDSPDVVIGCCGIRTASSEPGSGDLGVELSPDYWGKYKYAVEILTVLSELAFNELGLDRIKGHSIDANTRIGKLANSFGAACKVLEPTEWVRERGWQEVEWELTREQWQERVRSGQTQIG